MAGRNFIQPYTPIYPPSTFNPIIFHLALGSTEPYPLTLSRSPLNRRLPSLLPPSDVAAPCPLPKKGSDGVTLPSFVVTGLPSLAASRSPHRLLPPPSLLCVLGEQLHVTPNPNHSAPLLAPCAPTPVAARRGTTVAGLALALGARPWWHGVVVKQPRGQWICVGDVAEACGCGVTGEAMIGWRGTSDGCVHGGCCIAPRRAGCFGSSVSRIGCCC
ncbi:unnamed protein product [Urochloa humidicola]